MKRKFKMAIWIFGSVLLLYGAAYLGFYLLQDTFIFQSVSLPKNHQYRFNQDFEEHFIPTGDGEIINALLFKTEQPSKGLILYFHGNAGNLQRWGEYAIDFTALGYDILMTDYRGYGKSTGKPNEENLYGDAQTILTWAKENIGFNRLIIYGRSLGSAVASQLATTASANLLILETPFEELGDVIYFFSSHYEFSNKTFLPEVTCRRVIIQGTDDGIVPLSSALKLKPLLSEQDLFVIIEGGSHNNLREFEKYHRTLKEVLN